MKLNKSFNPVVLSFIMFLFIEAFVLSDSGKLNLNQNAKKIKDKDTVRIFNGKDLSNLKPVLKNKNNNPGEFYSIKNEILFIKNAAKGYLRTNENYSDFYLHAEWKWTETGEKGNSGILVFIQPPDTIWPDCIQANLKADHAGNLIAMNGASFKEADGKPKSTALIFNASSEKPEGEWNSCNVLCQDDSMIVYINGVLQNKATGIINHDGTIGLQLERKPIAFKNIYLIKK